MPRSLQRPIQTRDETLHPSTPVPHLKRRMGFSQLALHFTRSSVSTFPTSSTDAPRCPTHYCITTGARNVTHQASPTANSRILHSLPRGTFHTSAVTTKMETRCQHNVATPVVPSRPSARHRKKAGQLTQFSLTRSSANYECAALLPLLWQSRSGSQTVTAIPARTVRDTPGHWTSDYGVF